MTISSADALKRRIKRLEKLNRVIITLFNRRGVCDDLPDRLYAPWNKVSIPYSKYAHNRFECDGFHVVMIKPLKKLSLPAQRNGHLRKPLVSLPG